MWCRPQVTVADVVRGIGSLDTQLRATSLAASLLERRVKAQLSLLDSNEATRGEYLNRRSVAFLSGVC